MFWIRVYIVVSDWWQDGIDLVVNGFMILFCGFCGVIKDVSVIIVVGLGWVEYYFRYGFIVLLSCVFQCILDLKCVKKVVDIYNNMIIVVGGDFL